MCTGQCDNGVTNPSDLSIQVRCAQLCILDQPIIHNCGIASEWPYIKWCVQLSQIHNNRLTSLDVMDLAHLMDWVVWGYTTTSADVKWPITLSHWLAMPSHSNPMLLPKYGWLGKCTCIVQHTIDWLPLPRHCRDAVTCTQGVKAGYRTFSACRQLAEENLFESPTSASDTRENISPTVTLPITAPIGLYAVLPGAVTVPPNNWAILLDAQLTKWKFLANSCWTLSKCRAAQSLTVQILVGRYSNHQQLSLYRDPCPPNQISFHDGISSQ